MSVAPAIAKEKIRDLFEKEPHRVFDAETIATTLNPAAGRNPQLLEQLVGEIKAEIEKLVQDHVVRDVADGLFKACVYLDEARHMEHAFIGGMGNTLFRFRSPLFRLNIGTLAVFFMKHPERSEWRVLVRAATDGTAYCLHQPLTDGLYRLGDDPKRQERGFVCLKGRYIEPYHADISFNGTLVQIEDQKTPRGTRIDLLTESGLTAYQELAQRFLESAQPDEVWDPVVRGRFVMDEVLNAHKNYEVTFFGAMVDVLLDRRQGN